MPIGCCGRGDDVADIADLRLAVGQSRRELDRQRRVVHDAAALLNDLQRTLAEFGGPPPDVPDFGERLDGLSEQVPIEQQRLADADAAHAAARQAYDDAARQAGPVWDPGDDVPVLLLPVRLEAVYQLTAGATQLLLRVYPDDVHVDAHEDGLTDTELASGRRYWDRVGSAAPAARAAAEREAWAEVLSRLGPARGAWTVEATRPGAPEPGHRARRWNRAAHSQLLPDRFVFSAYAQRDDAPEGELELAWRHTGRDIPDTLAVGFPPRDDSQRPGRLPWDAASRWLVDFDEALDAGMALKVALPRPDVRYPLLTAVGVMAGLDADTTGARVQAALRAHQYGQGLAFLPVGTPTNNTPATRSGWRSRPEPRPPSELDAQRAAHDPAGPQAAARLARSLGVDGGPVLAAVPDALDDADDADLRRLHHAVGLLYTLSPILRPYPPVPANPDEIVVDDRVPVPDMPELVTHFTEHVRSRGSLPTVRVGRQPYGVLPATSLDLWRGPSPIPQLMEHLSSLLSSVEGRLDRVPIVGQGEDQDAVLLDLLSRLPASLRLKQTQTRPVELNASLVHRPPPAAFGTVPEHSRVEFFDLPDGETPPRDVLGPPDEETAAILAARPLAQLLAVSKERIAAFAADPGMDPAPFDSRHDAAWQVLLPLVDTPVPRTFHALAGRVLDELDILVRQLERLRLQPDDATDADRAFLPGALARQVEVAEAFVALEDRAVADLPGLDRLLLEVLDILSHRVDAWVTSFAQVRLEQARARRAVGVHVGAYGWLLDVHDTGPLPPGDGYVMTPSIQHAATAAVLRSGYLAHTDRSAFAVDLQSWRVRAAFDVVDGVRSGQPLGVLLGYRFERGLHDAQLDALVEPFRLAFPLPLAVDGAAEETPATSRTAIEARNVVDGQRLRRGELVPGVPDPRVQADAGSQEVVNRLLADLEDVVDAAGDLLLAESVHHLVGGNPLRAGLAADAIGHGDALPAEFESVRTHRSASGITYHVGLLADPDAATGWPASRPLAALAPVAEAWLAARLGPPEAWQFSRGGAPPLTLADLGWCAHDVVLGATRPVPASPLGRALRTAASDQPLDDAAWGRALDLAVLAELLRSLLVAATPLLPGHLDPNVQDPWAAVDLADLHDRVDGWLRGVRAARLRLHDAVGAATPSRSAVEQALADLAAAGLRSASSAPDASPAGAEPTDADIIATGAGILSALDEDQVAPLAAPPSGADAAGTGVEQWAQGATARVRALLGDAVVLAPRLRVLSPAPDAAPPGTSADEVEAWLRGVVGVRHGVAALADALAASSVLALRGPAAYVVTQQPAAPGRPWVATSPGTAGAQPGPRFTAVLHHDGPPPQRACGVVVDSWMEAVPRPGGEHGPTEVTGVAFHHDRPGARAPQALLLAVAPDPERGWSAEDLHAIVDDVVRLARMRGLDLRDLDGRPVDEGDPQPDLRRLLPIPDPD
jgi:hypothetical protein